ncbi:flagellar export chaperone FliS [Aquipuribacter sp. MA13-6]|uniref:flagellar export chaperone FliS n=1 Tax=unclassified Aquipuribacter TaxID=2635084 RepID=UPI003EED0C4E
MSAAAFGFATARTTTAARLNRFTDDALSTASPSQLLVKLFDRLVLDIARGEAAQRAGRHSAANEQLVHAQAIVAELMSSLDVDAWSGGARLMSVYSFLMSELVSANVQHDPERTAACGRIVEPLTDAWRQAATAGTAAVSPARAAVLGDADGVPTQRTSLVG